MYWRWKFRFLLMQNSLKLKVIFFYYCKVSVQIDRYAALRCLEPALPLLFIDFHVKYINKVIISVQKRFSNHRNDYPQQIETKRLMRCRWSTHNKKRNMEYISNWIHKSKCFKWFRVISRTYKMYHKKPISTRNWIAKLIILFIRLLVEPFGFWLQLSEAWFIAKSTQKFIVVTQKMGNHFSMQMLIFRVRANENWFYWHRVLIRDIG